MSLTAEQIEALNRGEPVEASESGVAFVMPRKDIYERLQTLFGDLSPEDTYPAILNAWDAAGSPEDGEAYKDFGR